MRLPHGSSGHRARGATGGLSASGYRRIAARRGFTLIEMLVSLAVVSVALTVVGVVFSVTTRAVSQAAALSEVQARVRQFALQFKEDFRFVDPSRSILVLEGRTQVAALSQDDLQAVKRIRYLVGDPFDPALDGYDPAGDQGLDPPGSNGVSEYSNPRADLIATFSLRPWASQAPPLNAAPNDQYASGAKFTPIQVVYGHAAFGTTKLNNGLHVWDTLLTHIETSKPLTQLSPLPTQRWHLARRATILNFQHAGGNSGPPTKPEFDRMVRCQATQKLAGDVLPSFRLDSYLTLASLENATNRMVTADPYGIRSNSQHKKLYRLANRMIYHRNDWQNNGRTSARHHVATILEEPPADLRNNIGLHLLAGCGWFQVEFLMPEDPRNSRDYYDIQPDPLKRSRRDDMPRWVEVPPGRTFVFVPDTADNRRTLVEGQYDSRARYRTFARVNVNGSDDDVTNKRIRLWPYAIRVTIKVYDPRGRLTVPVVRTIVQRFD